MDNEDIKNAAIYISVMLIMVACMWGMGKLFSDSISDYEVINPKDGIDCIVVSRMFNTSVDCWKNNG